jgi:hypothetical protein
MRKIMSPDVPVPPEPLRSVAAMKSAIMTLVDTNLRALEKELILNPNQIASMARLLDIVDKIQRMEDPEPPQSGKSTAEILGLK